MAQAPDYRVETLLREIGVPFELTDEGDFRVSVAVGDGTHTQLLVIRNETTMLGGTEWRTVGSAGYRVRGNAMPKAVANLLLDHNSTVPIGGWMKLVAGDDCIAVFAARIPADCSSDFFREILQGVAATADGMERHLHGDSEGSRRATRVEAADEDAPAES